MILSNTQRSCRVIHGRLLLAQAVQGAKAQHQIHGVNSHYRTVRE